MRATYEYVERKFNEYNALIFGGELKPLPIRIVRARSFLGQIAFKRKRNLLGGWHYYDFIFKISIVLDQEENVVEDTILHEMIHYYILSNQLQDTSPHGKFFRKMMTEINQRYNRNITISHSSTCKERESDTRQRQHLVCIARLTDGRVGMMVIAHSRLFEFWDKLPRLPLVDKCEWFTTFNPYFNRYKRSQSIRLYEFSQESIDEHLADAKPLVREGNTIMVARM